MSYTGKAILDALAEYANFMHKEHRTPQSWFAVEAFENSAALDHLRSRLADEESQMVFDWMIRARLGAFLFRNLAKTLEVFPPRIASQKWEHMAAKAKAMPEAILERNIEVDLVENFVLDGYNLPGICEVLPTDIVLDLGGFNGNSAIALGRHCPDGKVYVFEPNPVMHGVITRNLAVFDMQNVELVPMGVGEKSEKLRFSEKGAASRPDPTGNHEVDITTVDEWVRLNGLTHVDFIKFDIEGFERQAMQGARATIRAHRPKLAISIYHLHDDPVVLSRMVDALGWYKMYLRHNAYGMGEIVLFCDPI